MREKKITLTMEALDRNGICLAQAPVGAGNLTIAGAYASGGVATLDVPRHVGIYSAGDDSAVTFTVTGTDRTGAALTESISGAAAGATTAGTKNFATVTQVAIDGASAGNVEVGTIDSLEGQIIPVYGKVDWAVNLSAGASLSCALQYTQEDFLSDKTKTEDNLYWDSDGLVAVDDMSANYSLPVPSGVVNGVRLALDNFVSGSAVLTLIPKKYR